MCSPNRLSTMLWQWLQYFQTSMNEYWHYYFPPYLKYGREIIQFTRTFFYTMFATWECPMLENRTLSDREIIFWPNCIKFSLECDRNSNNSPNVQIWDFFENDGFFFEKNLNFKQNHSKWQICCRMRIKWYFFLKMSFPPY